MDRIPIYSKWLSIGILSGAFLVSSEIPMLASPLQSSGSGQNSQTLPDAPQSQPAPAATQQEVPPPSGAAGAKAGNAKGVPVAQPAGAAVAPARQHGHRSLLIKLGLLAGAGVAIGSAVALSKGSPSRPPGVSSRANP